MGQAALKAECLASDCDVLCDYQGSTQECGAAFVPPDLTEGRAYEIAMWLKKGSDTLNPPSRIGYRTNREFFGLPHELTDGKSYLFPRLRLSFEDAADFCTSFGHQLAAVDGPETAAWFAERSGGYNLWAGATDQELEGAWLDRNGRTPTYFNWYPNQPDNSGGDENCLELLVAADADLRFNDVTCTQQNNFVCETPDTGVVALALHQDPRSDRGESVYFNSDKNNYYTVQGDLTSTIGSGDVTFAAWVKIADFNGRSNIMAQEGAMMIGLSWKKLQVQSVGDTSWHQGNTALTQGKWTHLVVTQEGGGALKGYVDGVLDLEDSSPQSEFAFNENDFLTAPGWE